MPREPIGQHPASCDALLVERWDRQNTAREEETRSIICMPSADDPAVTTDHASIVPVSSPVSVSTSEKYLLKLMHLPDDTQIRTRLDKRAETNLTTSASGHCGELILHDSRSMTARVTS